MTREEAKTRLTAMKAKFEMLLSMRGLEMSDVFDLAIEALSTEPCEDCINRAELLKAIDTWDKFGVDDTNSLFRLDNLSLPHYVPYMHYDDVVKCIKGMPPVTPKQKMGYWEEHNDDHYDWVECHDCGYGAEGEITSENGVRFNFCPNCGAEMVESEEE